MPTYLSPGVYVEEVDGGSKPIAGVGTAVAAFVGFAQKGPVNQLTLVTNWTQYVEAFGEFMEGYIGGLIKLNQPFGERKHVAVPVRPVVAGCSRMQQRQG